MSMHIRSRGDKIFDACNVILLAFVGFIALYPFLYVVALSFSSNVEASKPALRILPAEFNLTAYRMVLTDEGILTGYYNTVVRTILGTALTLLLTCLTAYPLSRKEMPFQSPLMFAVLFTMLFGGGLVPTYLLMKNLGLINTVWSLVLPGAVTAFNIIVMRNFFKSIPEELIESARIDGAREWTILFRIVVPLSKPVLATVALWTVVAHWNHWFDALLYITDDSKQVLQIFLQRIVVESSTEAIEMGLVDADAASYSPDTIKAATVVVTILPMLAVYPFIQRYFVKGIMLGGVKE